MKTKIGSTKKLLMASVALLASLGVAAGSTFAWFTTSDNVSISGLDAKIVSGSDALTMAVVAPTQAINDEWLRGQPTFSSGLTGTQIQAVIGENVTLTAATSTNGKTFTGREAGSTVSANQTSGGYYSFRLVFRNRLAGGNTNIFLAANSAVTPTEQKPATVLPVPFNTTQYDVIAGNLGLAGTQDLTYYGSSIEANAATLETRGAYAARVSFVPTLLAAGTDDYNATTVAAKLWAPNEHNATGAIETTATSTTNGKGFWKNNLANDYYYDSFNIAHQPITQASMNNTVVPATSTTAEGGATTTTYTSANLVATIDTNSDTGLVDPYYAYTSVVVNIWLEGTDGDCFDAILTDTFSTTLSFVVAPITTP